MFPAQLDEVCCIVPLGEETISATDVCFTSDDLYILNHGWNAGGGHKHRNVLYNVMQSTVMTQNKLINKYNNK